MSRVTQSAHPALVEERKTGLLEDGGALSGASSEEGTGMPPPPGFNTRKEEIWKKNVNTGRWMSDGTSSEFTIGGRGLQTLLLVFVCARGECLPNTLCWSKKNPGPSSPAAAASCLEASLCSSTPPPPAPRRWRPQAWVRAERGESQTFAPRQELGVRSQ